MTRRIRAAAKAPATVLLPATLRLTERATDGWLNEYLPIEARNRLVADAARVKHAQRRDAREQAGRAIAGTEGGGQDGRNLARVTIRLPVEIEPGVTRLQRADVLRYGDAHLVDRMADRGQLNDRQHANAAALLSLWRAAGLEPQTTADLGAGPRGQAPQADDGEAAAEDYFHREMRRFRGQPAAILMAMLRGEHPGVAWLATLQATLDRLDHLPGRWGGELWAAENAD